jgi:hypothetical protein
MEGTPQKVQLGYTLLDRPVELNYSEGGHLVSHGLGGALAPPYWGARGAEPRGSCSHRTACF